MIERLKNIGPGAIIAASFTGPGTVTTASVTGASYDYVLLWAILAATLGTIILQEMAVRVGLVTNQGLGEAMDGQFTNPITHWTIALLIIGAIGIGAASYQAGDLIGGAGGLASLTGISEGYWGPLMGLAIGITLFIGRYKLVERLLVGMVALMAFSFVGAAILAGPELGPILTGFVPTGIPDGGLFLVTGIMGTQIVGYNLFLHASSATERWTGPGDLRDGRIDTVASIAIGGLIMVAILITAAAAFPEGTEISNVGTMADQIEPLVGSHAQFLFGIGLFAAGFSSGLTAPLGASYAICGVMGWEQDLKAPRFRAIWMSIIAFGLFATTVGFEPVQAIIFAQVANGMLLPILAVFLLYVLNDRDLLGEYTNSTTQNVLGGLVALFVIWLGLNSLLDVLGVL